MSLLNSIIRYIQPDIRRQLRADNTNRVVPQTSNSNSLVNHANRPTNSAPSAPSGSVVLNLNVRSAISQPLPPLPGQQYSTEFPGLTRGKTPVYNEYTTRQILDSESEENPYATIGDVVRDSESEENPYATIGDVVRDSESEENPYATIGDVMRDSLNIRNANLSELGGGNNSTQEDLLVTLERLRQRSNFPPLPPLPEHLELSELENRTDLPRNYNEYN